ncbi:bifunctional 2-polyprenyl-6-hydroxyphenol methylase/3-demethylubiquinol 3-O-methyltransferase UbiG [Ehrlichia sp. JZT12]
MNETVNKNELLKFSKISDKWWNEEGPFSALHKIHHLRMKYIVDYIRKVIPDTDLRSLSVLDVGCGGGLLSESIARLGMKIVGIDASEENINVARSHALERNLPNLDYHCTTVGALVDSQKRYDIITVMEVVEHVDNLPIFIKNICSVLSDNGIIFLSTLNRTIKSLLYAIIGAEYILRLVPCGTHQWNKFIKPSELANLFLLHDVSLKGIKGINFSILKNCWQLSEDISVNYILTAQKS